MTHKQPTIDYGKVEKYIEDRGFGFVTQTFAKIQPKGVFFHIKVVKRTHLELAQVLDSATTHEEVYFWYEYVTSFKGQEVLTVLDLKQIQQKYPDHKAAFIDTLKTSWMDVKNPLSEALRKATSDLLTSDEVNQLMASREAVKEEQRKHQEELQKAEATRVQAIAEQRDDQLKAEAARIQVIAVLRAAQQKAEASRIQAIAILKVAQQRAVIAERHATVEQWAVQRRAKAAKVQAIEEQRAAQLKAQAVEWQAIAERKAAQQKVEEEEFCQLVAEISALRYTRSSQVSEYIVSHGLGYKYKNISGILQMESNGSVWNFNGGFPPNIYARLCSELGLRNRGSAAVPVAFTPYKNID